MTKLWTKYSFIILFSILTLSFGFYLSFTLSSEEEDSFLHVEVQKGDTLWSLSREHAESLSMSEKDFIEWVTVENNLVSYKIIEGIELKLPIREQDTERFLNDDIQLASENQ